MAYVNVKDWSVDQVTDWLKGLDTVILQYAKSFLNNGVNGHQLLSLRADDLEHLGVTIVGHQELILEAVEHLRNFHYELDKENLQMLALRLSCAANSLFKELLLFDDDCKKVPTQTMSDVHNIIKCIKPLVYWLDRSPFRGDKDYMDNKMQLLQLSIEMATCAHRDIFSEQPVRTIRNICETLAKQADHIIQEISDPMILQPASLDLTTLRKKEQELGFFILPTYHPIHQIAEIKYGSPAHASSKIEEGDEIVQVNYQTVVGWQRKKVEILLQESPPEIVLTLKKRPRHTKVYGQIYMKPYRLPSKKRQTPYSRWNENLPSPGLLTIHDLPQIPAPKEPVETNRQELETEISSESDSEPPDSPLDATERHYIKPPRSTLQRRNTITGASPVSIRPTQAVEQFWKQLKNQAASTHSSSYHIQADNFEEDSMFLRDKSASCSHGLELAQRPTTVIGIAQKERRNSNFKNSFKKDFQEKTISKKKVNFEDPNQIQKSNGAQEKVENKNVQEPSNLKASEEKSVSVSSLSSLSGANESIDFIDDADDLTDRSKMKIDEKEDKAEDIKLSPSDLKPIDSREDGDVSNTSITSCRDAVFADVHIHNIIKKFDASSETKNTPVKPQVMPRYNINKTPPEIPQKIDKKPAVPPRNLRGKLDKSHSTPAYDFNSENSDISKVPTIIERTVEPFKDVYQSNEPIRLELGIPVVEARNPSLTLDLSSDMDKSDSEYITIGRYVEIKDVPPKPPPRTCTLENYRPRYPAESPKPVCETPRRPVKDVNVTKSPIYEQGVEPNYLIPDTHIYGEHFSTQDHLELRKISNIKQEHFMKHERQRQELMQQTYALYENNEIVRNKFEPKSVSTPVSKQCKIDYPEVDIHGKIVPHTDIPKPSSESKVSPTNSVVRAMIYSSKSKSSKKKNTLLARRRKVSVNEVSPGELQGFLFQRIRHKHTQNVYWEKRWFVLNGNCLYGFKSKDASKAEALICLTGFTATIAEEVKSKTNAFKVYHTGKVFYFSADDPETVSVWIEKISAATLHNDLSKTAEEIICSETDESDSEKSKSSTVEKPSETIKKFGSLKKFTSKKSSSSSNSDSTQSGSTSLDRKWFFKSHNIKSSVPVPTAQFRSYRKYPSSNINMGSVSTGNFTSHIPNFAPRLELQTLSQSQNVSVPNLSIEPPKTPEVEKVARKSSMPLTKPTSYIHASNPSLCASDFITPFPKIKPPFNDNLEGFVTLAELMNRQTEERKLNPHLQDEVPIINPNLIKPDVVYGEVPIRSKEKEEKPKKRHSRTASDCSESKKDQKESSSCFGKRSGSIKKSQKDNEESKMYTYPKSSKNQEDKINRSLPRTHKLQESYPEDSWGAQCQRQFITESEACRSLSNLEERSYEMIYCPQKVSDVQFAQNRSLDARMYHDTPKKTNKIVRQLSLNSADKKRINEERSYLDSLKRFDKVADKNYTKIKLKPAMQYTPMSMPLTPDDKGKFNPKFAFELNLDDKSSKSGKLKSFFSKQSDVKKEKSFLGSPKLHRAIFRKHNVSSDLEWPSHNPQMMPAIVTSNSFTAINTISETNTELPVLHHSPPADYPGLEYPPIFEPETYSLADPQISLSLLRKQGKGNEK